MTGYDIIGDIHGHAEPLERLLAEMGYRERAGAYRHPSRQVVFVGDLVDRGPAQPRVVEIARSMVEAGSAQIVMGNHEFNAIAWATWDDARGDWCRPHSDKNLDQHGAFLDQVGEDSSLHRELIDWFRTIPMWLDLDGVRVVHACWDPASMEVLGGPELSPEAVSAAKGSDLYDAIEVVLKGPEIDLGGRCYRDKGEHPRHRARFRWWDPGATTLASGAEIPEDSEACDGGAFGDLPHTPLPADLPVLTDGAPVLYGHYWRKGQPVVDGPRSACLDWSIAMGGRLAAYRWSGEPELTNDNLTAVK